MRASVKGVPPAIAGASVRSDRLPAGLWALQFAFFVIGVGVMVVPGMLSDLSAALQVPVATAGLLITAGSLMNCLATPVLATFVAGRDGRRLLTLSMIWYGTCQLSCVFVSTFAAMVALRVLAVFASATMWTQAAVCAGQFLPTGQRGRAMTFVYLGWTLASVLGMPMGAYIGGTLGWKSAYAVVALMSLACALWVWRCVPDGMRAPALSLAGWGSVFRSGTMMLCVLVTLLFFSAQAVTMSYLSPYFKATLAVTPGQLGLLFMWFGALGVAGNMLMTRHVDRLGAARAVLAAYSCVALGLLILPLGGSPLTAALVLVPWALGCFAASSAQQVRLVGLAPQLASASVALNSSAVSAGQAIGTTVGGWLIAHGAMPSLPWASFIILLVAIAGSIWAMKRAGGR
jgi:predicted MFS family arabinose efflux permease